MATKIQDVDIRLVLARLRPHSAYHWVGLGDTGNTMDAIKSWRDLVDPIPTEGEVIQEWDKYQTEVAAQAVKDAEKRVDYDGVKPSTIQAALDQLDLDLAAIPAADTVALKQILGRTLVRQRAIIRALRHIVE